MPDRSSFDIALRSGQQHEQFAYDLLTGLHGQYEVRPYVTLEVKDQSRSRTHVFIEHASFGRAAGIAVTEADWWVLEVLPGRLVFIRTVELRALYERALEEFGERRGGDDNAAFGAIVPKTWLV